MYLYNISIIADESVHQAISKWIVEHILASENYEVKFLEMLHSPHEGVTYCAQVIVDSEEQINDFRQNYVQPLQQFIGEHYQDKAFIFDSTMKYLH